MRRFFDHDCAAEKDQPLKRIHAEFRKRFAIKFRNPKLLMTALTHRSYDAQSETSNERLEFLGDSVLNLVATDYLYRAMPDASEGELTKARSRLVNKNVLGKIGRNIGLLELLLYARDEIRDDERAFATLSADTLEAVIGAIFLDQGLKRAYAFVVERILEPLSNGRYSDTTIDYKSRLQELCQARFKVHPDYRIVKKVGPEHRKIFHVEVRIKGETYGFGSGRSRKEAEQVAASQALLNLADDADEASLKSLDS